LALACCMSLPDNISPMARMQFIVLFLTLLVPAAALASFPDVPPSHPNYDAINYVQSEGIGEGYSDGTYGADKTINRAEFTKIIIRAAYRPADNDPGIEEGYQGEPVFPDVYNAWYAKYVYIAKTLGWVQGDHDGIFRPANAINFVEAAKILVRAFDLPVPSDAELEYENAWYEAYVKMLESKNAIPLSITDFGQGITRGDMAEMVYRLKTGNTEKESRTYEELMSSVWKHYENSIVGYNIFYPLDAEIDEFPESAESSSVMPGQVVDIAYRSGRIQICSTDIDYPCGPTGIGIGAERIQQKVLINDIEQTFHGWKYDEPEYYFEHLTLSIDGNTHSNVTVLISVGDEHGITQKEYEDTWLGIKKMLETLHVDPK